MKHVINCETSVDLQKVTNVYSLNYRIEDYEVSDSLEGKITLYGKYVKDNLEEILDYEEEVEFTVDFDRNKYSITAVECDNLEYDVIFGRGLTVTYDVIIDYEDRDEEIELIKDMVDEETDEILEEVLKNRDDSFLDDNYQEAEYAEINREDESEEEIDDEDTNYVEDIQSGLDEDQDTHVEDKLDFDIQDGLDEDEDTHEEVKEEEYSHVREEPSGEIIQEEEVNVNETKYETKEKVFAENELEDEKQNTMEINRVNINEKDESFIGNLKESYTTYKVVYNVSERNVEELAKKYNKTVEQIYRENNYSINNNLLIKDESKK